MTMRVLLPLLFLLSFSVIAQSVLTQTQQLEVVQSIAKDERREMWRTGNTNVGTEVQKLSTLTLSQFLRDNQDFVQPLTATQMGQLKGCAASSACGLFSIDVYLSNNGGDGQYRVWVMLSTDTGRTRKIQHWVYEE